MRSHGNRAGQTKKGKSKGNHAGKGKRGKRSISIPKLPYKERFMKFLNNDTLSKMQPFEKLLELTTTFNYVLDNLKDNKIAIKLNLNTIEELQRKMKEAFKKMGTQIDKILFEIYQNYLAIINVNENVDRNYAGIRKAMYDVTRNFDAITDDTTKTDKILQTIEQKFNSVSKNTNQTSDKDFKWFEKVEELFRSRSIQKKNSELASFLKEFAEIRENLEHGSRIDDLTGDDGYHKYFKHGRTPKSTKSLYILLDDILNEGIAVPMNANDDAAFTALQLLLLGTSTYIQMFEFVMIGNVHAMKENYKNSDVQKFNQHYRESVAEFHAYQSNLCGIGSEDGLISEVIRVLTQIQKLPFLKETTHDFFILSQKIKLFRDIEKSIANITYTCHDEPTNGLRPKLKNSGINTPFLAWRDARRVRYAVQYVQDRMFSLISDWSVPFIIDGTACPALDIGDVPSGTTRVIFRQFDHDKPKLVSVVYDSDQTEFQDFDRDLYDAVLEGNRQLAKKNACKLIERGANVTAKFENGREVIHAATKAGNIDVVRDLLKRGVDINARDGAGYAPLHIAAESGDEDLVQDLIKLGADVRASSHLNWTALHVAAKHGHFKTLKVLEKADLNAKAAGGFTPLHMAVNSRRKRAAELLISNKKTDANAQSDKLLTPLHLAVLGLDERSVEMLLSNAKCDVNSRAHGGLTALHLAVISGDENIVEQLVQNNGTNINAKSDEGWSSLHFAISFKKRSAFDKLLNSAGINVNLEGKDKITPLQLANRLGQEDIILELKNHGAHVESERSPIPSSTQNASKEVDVLGEEQEPLRFYSNVKNSSNVQSNITTFHSSNVNVRIPPQENSPELQNSSRVSFKEDFLLLKNDGQTDTELPSDQLSYSPSMVNNIFLVKWLFHVLGRRSFVKSMRKVEGSVDNLRLEDSHWAERLLHQGMAQFGQPQP